jgi:hypothetical protein
MVGDVIKGIFITIVLVLLTGQVSAYTPEQQTLIDGMNLRCQLCTAHDKAIQGQNVTEFNNLVDIYNEWIRQHFDKGADALLMSKITPTNLPKQQVMTGTQYLTRNPFNASSDLGKFGKQKVSRELSAGESHYIEATTADRNLRNFLSGD